MAEFEEYLQLELGAEIKNWRVRLDQISESET